jgi:hypothetical protein
MCGEIEDWQIARTIVVRMTVGTSQKIDLSNLFDQVEEIRLTESFVTNFQGGINGTGYLELDIMGLNNVIVSNERRKGVLIMVDNLNPHSIYSNPRIIATGGLTSIQSFQCRFLDSTAAAAPVTFDEAVFVFTFVCRRPVESIAEVRKLRHMMDYPPTRKDGAIGNSYQN